MSVSLFDLPAGQPLKDHVVVFTGKLSLLGRRDARALVERLGGTAAEEVNAKTTLLVLGAEGFPSGADVARTDGPPKSQKLRRAEQLREEKAAPIRILSEAEFCTLVGLPSADTLKQQYYSLRDLLSLYASVREDHLRYLQKWGIIRPVLVTNADSYFTFADLGVIKQVNAELEQGTPFRRVLKALAPPSRDQGQLSFDFRLDAAPARIIELRRPAPAAGATPAGRRTGLLPPPSVSSPSSEVMAEQYFAAASMLDDGSEENQERAAAAYRKALEIDPYLVAALINLANIHYGRNELAEAQALYERAIGLEPEFFEAHFNLGNIYHDLGRLDEAVACYREALKLNPGYADAHFYMAVACEKVGLSAEARPHWKAYQRLAPDGEWVELAKEFSGD
ncbi:MAG: tetratricopeptide repeat protein [Acidobacteriota bacterium]|nr:tetratricopeptide repeat protein [Acidobacteriota bacterium]